MGDQSNRAADRVPHPSVVRFRGRRRAISAWVIPAVVGIAIVLGGWWLLEGVRDREPVRLSPEAIGTTGHAGAATADRIGVLSADAVGRPVRVDGVTVERITGAHSFLVRDSAGTRAAVVWRESRRDAQDGMRVAQGQIISVAGVVRRSTGAGGEAVYIEADSVSPSTARTY